MAKPYRLKEIIDYEMENTIEAFPARQHHASYGSKSFAHLPTTALLDEPALWKTALQIETEMLASAHSSQGWK